MPKSESPVPRWDIEANIDIPSRPHLRLAMGMHIWRLMLQPDGSVEVMLVMHPNDDTLMVVPSSGNVVTLTTRKA